MKSKKSPWFKGSAQAPWEPCGYKCEAWPECGCAPTNKVDVNLTLNDSTITSEIFTDIEGVRDQIFKRVLDVQDRQVREALVRLGWTPPQQSEGNYPSHPSEFREGQWWLKKLDAMVRDGTPDQKRAVAVVRHLLKSAQQSAEPVALKVWHPAGGAFYVGTEKPERYRIDTGEPDEYFGGVVEPLYTHPPTHPPTAAQAGAAE